MKIQKKFAKSFVFTEPLTPASFGRLLTAAREKRGLSILDAAHETRIHARWLILLEEGNVAAFGSMTYARSFVRGYSAFLGVDSSAYLLTLPAGGFLGGERDYRYLVHSQGPWLRERTAQIPELKRARASVPQVPKLRHITSPIPAGLGVFALMLMATAMWGMHIADSPPQSQANTQIEAFKALPFAEIETTPSARFAQMRIPVPQGAVD